MYTEEKKIQEALDNYLMDKSRDSLTVIYDNTKYLFRKIIGKYYLRHFGCSDAIEAVIHSAASDIVEGVCSGKYTNIRTLYLIRYVRKYFGHNADTCMPALQQEEDYDMDLIVDEKPVYDEINFKLSLEKLVETYHNSVQIKTPFHDNAVNNLLALLSLKLVFESYDMVDLHERRLGFYLSFFKHDMIELIKFFYEI